MSALQIYAPNLKECPHCRDLKDPRGFKNHEMMCKDNPDREINLEALKDKLYFLSTPEAAQHHGKRGGEKPSLLKIIRKQKKCDLDCPFWHCHVAFLSQKGECVITSQDHAITMRTLRRLTLGGADGLKQEIIETLAHLKDLIYKGKPTVKEVSLYMAELERVKKMFFGNTVNVFVQEEQEKGKLETFMEAYEIPVLEGEAAPDDTS